jgi:hypothetical protein
MPITLHTAMPVALPAALPAALRVALPGRRQLLQAALAGAVVSGLAGCSAWTGPPVITLGEAELADRLGRLFPLTRRVLEVLDIELSAPRLRLLPESNRLSLALWLRSRERLLGNAGHGQLAFDCALRWVPQEASLRLTQVRVQQLWFERGPGPAAPPSAPPPAPPSATPSATPPGPLTATPPGPPSGSPPWPPGDGAAPRDAAAAPSRLGPALAEKVLEDLLIYRLGAEPAARLRAAGLAPGAVTVTARGVEITLQRVTG